MAVSAQAKTSVVGHYRAYAAALERNDLAAAEAAAAAAVEASDALGVDGPRTAILLTNLAQVRLDRGDGAGAGAPAQRARSLAEAQGDAAQVDPHGIRLLHAHAQFVADNERGADSLQRVLDQSSVNDALENERLLAARALAAWAMRAEEWSKAILAFSTIIEVLPADNPAAVLDIADARIARGRALVELYWIRRRMPESASLTAASPQAQAESDYLQALALMRPYVEQSGPEGELTRVQQLYAVGVSWAAILNSALVWNREPESAELDAALAMASVDLNALDGAPVCTWRLNQQPLPRYPNDAVARYRLGSVVFRFKTNADGEIVDRAVVAAAGAELLETAIERAHGQWTLERAEDSVEPCTMEGVHFFAEQYHRTGWLPLGF
jgi:hypothetical protein